MNAKRLIKRSLLGFVAIVAMLLVTIVATAALVWFRPGVVVNTPRLLWALPHLESMGYALELEAPQLQADSPEFWRKRVVLKTPRACWKNPLVATGPLCLRDVDIEVVANLKPGATRPLLVRRLRFYAEAFELKIPESTEPPDAEASPSSWTSSLAWLAWEEVDATLERLRLPAEDSRWDFAGRLESAGREELALKAQAELHSTLPKPPPPFRFETELRLRTDLLDREFALSTSRADLSVKGSGPGLKAAVGGHLEFKARRLDFSLSGDGSWRGPTSLSFRLDRCQGQGRLVEGDRPIPVDDALAECSVRVVPTYPAALTKRYGSRVPKEFRLELRAEAKTQKDGALHPRLSAKLLPVRTPIFVFEAEAEAVPRRTLGFDVTLKGDLKLPDFRKAAAASNELGWIVPAPVAVLGGPVQLTFSGTGESETPTGRADFKLTTRLRSRDQALRLVADGELRFRQCRAGEEGSSFEVDLVSREALLELPAIDYTRPPPIVPDSRFEIKAEPRRTEVAARAAPTGCTRRLDLRVRTGENAPVRIAGPILKNPIPVHLDVRKSDADAGRGYLRVENFSTELFRRKATVERFDFDIATRVVNGRVRADFTDHRITTLITGSADSIRVDFESDPPLSRQAALSVLLFGRTMEGLDDEQASSVAKTEAAAKNGALSLASLYLFASTPIESVGYDPQTQGVTAKVRLGDGTSLNVGANDRGVTDVGVRRRLSREWRVETTVRNPSDPQNRSTLTILEWFRRF